MKKEILGKAYEIGSVRQLAQSARKGVRFLSSATDTLRRNLLTKIKESVLDSKQAILQANIEDRDRSQSSGLSESMMARLVLDEAKLEKVCNGISEVADLPDPVGRVEKLSTRPNGLELERMSVPLGLVGMIYESRPEVTLDAAALCLKSGNAVLLRGGSEAYLTNHSLIKPIRAALESLDVPPDAVSMLATTDRAAITEMVGLAGLVDIIVPRGGEALVEFVRDNARVPVIYHAKGVCHIFVDGESDQKMALRIAVNAKCSAPAVCNALETLLVDDAIKENFIPAIGKTFSENQVKIHGCPRTVKILTDAVPVTDKDLDQEYLAKEVSVVVVDGLQGALDHIDRFGSGHTDAIITSNSSHADRFLREVDSSSVMVNTSTRFADGGQYGLGAEIGISTQKLPPRGPVGVEGLTTWKFVLRGTGQVRL